MCSHPNGQPALANGTSASGYGLYANDYAAHDGKFGRALHVDEAKPYRLNKSLCKVNSLIVRFLPRSGNTIKFYIKFRVLY